MNFDGTQFLGVPIKWIPHDLNTSDKHLLQYFESVAASSLRCIGQSSTTLRSTLIRMALSDDSPTSTGLVNSLLALASLHRYGLQRQAVQYKMVALKAMKDSVTSIIKGVDISQHIAAGMLLCSFEVSDPFLKMMDVTQIKQVQTATVTCGHWISYVQGAKTMINLATSPSFLNAGSDYSVLLRWVHYHDVMAQFSLRHWEGFGGASLNTKKRTIEDLILRLRENVSFRSQSRPSNILDLLEEVCNNVVDPSDSRYTKEDYRDYLKELEGKLRQDKLSELDISLWPAEEWTEASRMAELYTLATLYEFLKQLSDNPANIIIGLVRDTSVANDKIQKQLPGRQNIHVLQGDITDYNSLKIKNSVEKVSQITNGSLDYIIANAGFVSPWSEYIDVGDLGKDPEKLNKDLADCLNINLIGNIHLFNLFIPLVLRSSIKKVVTISSGHADLDLVTKYEISTSAPYTISKTAMNAAVAKYSAQYSSQGVLFMSISPGVVDTGHTDNLTPDQLQSLTKTGLKFAAYAPHFKGPISPEESVRHVLSVIDKSSVAGGNGGSFVSHFGNKQWI
ncbi:transcriptional regulator family: Fungal Specific TF [Trichoderma aggressivum f. europaeum]|uniref:Transcriptional regulator family: Fungal Specific TF n=1 Tax=Trichoderma aggressivum f. europaeum TaxID=173218 RepID=A0AAE1I6S7_9HYPO|nr:transcriptional regulator family: Fungal Specific TF [Trichoderma aggressivum f. europaeum]